MINQRKVTEKTKEARKRHIQQTEETIQRLQTKIARDRATLKYYEDLLKKQSHSDLPILLAIVNADLRNPESAEDYQWAAIYYLPDIGISVTEIQEACLRREDVSIWSEAIRLDDKLSNIFPAKAPHGIVDQSIVQEAVSKIKYIINGAHNLADIRTRLTAYAAT